jgi:hypothetical protein
VKKKILTIGILLCPIRAFSLDSGIYFAIEINPGESSDSLRAEMMTKLHCRTTSKSNLYFCEQPPIQGGKQFPGVKRVFRAVFDPKQNEFISCQAASTKPFTQAADLLKISQDVNRTISGQMLAGASTTVTGKATPVEKPESGEVGSGFMIPGQDALPGEAGEVACTLLSGVAKNKDTTSVYIGNLSCDYNLSARTALTIGYDGLLAQRGAGNSGLTTGSGGFSAAVKQVIYANDEKGIYGSVGLGVSMPNPASVAKGLQEPGIVVTPNWAITKKKNLGNSNVDLSVYGSIDFNKDFRQYNAGAVVGYQVTDKLAAYAGFELDYRNKNSYQCWASAGAKYAVTEKFSVGAGVSHSLCNRGRDNSPETRFTIGAQMAF